jgi:hypothetical protein
MTTRAQFSCRQTAMSSSRNVAIWLVLATFAFGCAGEFDAVTDSTDEIVDNLLVAGYPASEIDILEEGVVVVGGDAVVSLEASREMIGRDGAKGQEDAHGDLKHYRTNNLVASSIKTICIDGSAFTGTLSTALDNAIANYNNIGPSFTFVRTNGSGAGCDALITAVVATGVGGSAGFPAGGLPYGWINIGSGTASYGTAVTTHVIMHEIGHCIGFRHTDYYDRSISCGGYYNNEGGAGVGANHIPNTPTGAVVDGSVMNSCFHSGSTGQWTSDDIAALDELYPRPACSLPVSWWDGSTITPWFDGANCVVATPPNGSTPYVYQNKYYITSGAATYCPLGSFDGANCYIQPIRAGDFIYANGLYSVTVAGTCPAGSSFDGANCFWFTIPVGTSLFQYAGLWHSTAQPSCQAGIYDGNDCWMGTAPNATEAFVHANIFHYAD